jgi:hypothetical protein
MVLIELFEGLFYLSLMYLNPIKRIFPQANRVISEVTEVFWRFLIQPKVVKQSVSVTLLFIRLIHLT